MAKAMGCNTIAAYIMWNYHELSPGVFDFKTGNRNMASLCAFANKRECLTLLEPGPMFALNGIFGGFAFTILKIPDIKIRCRDPRYMKALSAYVTALCAQVKSLQCTRASILILVK